MASRALRRRRRSGNRDDVQFAALEALSTPMFIRAMHLGMFDLDEDHELFDPFAIQERRRGADNRTRRPRVWGEAGKVMNEDWELALRNIDTPDSREGHTFRHRYGVSPKVLMRLLQDMENEDWMEFTSRNLVQRRSFIPTRIKLLISLRRLARNETFDTLHQMSGVGASTVRTIFLNFIRLLVTSKFKDVIRPPQGAEVARILEINERVGLPGCLSSTDGVHFVNDKAPATALQVGIPKQHAPCLYSASTDTVSPRRRNPKASVTSQQFACRCL